MDALSSLLPRQFKPPPKVTSSRYYDPECKIEKLPYQPMKKYVSWLPTPMQDLKRSISLGEEILQFYDYIKVLSVLYESEIDTCPSQLHCSLSLHLSDILFPYSYSNFAI